eukprot:Tbor_TRINITY_DN5225_c0_g3::TRINITY_DN5225_c0_g3_i1::g.16327::m.16327
MRSTSIDLTTRLYTSFYRGLMSPSMVSLPKAKVKGGSFRSRLFSKYSTKNDDNTNDKHVVDINDVLLKNTKKSGVVIAESFGSRMLKLNNSRPYVPLSEIGEIELQGDYLMEGGQYFDALQYYGVVAKAYSIAYPSENHNQRAKIAIKVSRAFRMCDLYESAKGNAEHALYMLDNNSNPHLDLVCEGLIELGLTQELMLDPTAGRTYEDVVHIINTYHSFGESHRFLRRLPRLANRMSLNFEKKFLHFSPYVFDRVYALGDYALHLAEKAYRHGPCRDQASLVRVLEARTKLTDKKVFDMRDYSGKFGTWCGRASRHKAHLSGASSPSELLMYSPTIHQIYVDRSHTNLAPVGEEDTVMPGSNRKVLDDGSPERKSPKKSLPMKSIFAGRKSTSMSEIYEY